ncbi:putative copper resistance protein D [Humibacillus xanthopallidus]|uniref:Putative copper resistance protein D n=1 Tax=Humibacillus xanthopallidus TaxID=412689 RepID=A0A543PT97_9MICO|nr:cytochrome c oxidase assembly protein [Humibacillus xanthopallidus]TQN47290.1 putative copper resistance protein D [Humibacillus xanthopallidus]
MPVLTPSSLLADWTASPAGLALVGVVTVPYAVAVLRARASGVPWPWRRPALFLLAGVGSLAYAVCGPLAVHRTEVFWIACLQVGVLASLTPVGLALGDPVGLVRARSRAAGGERTPLLLRLVEGRVARVLTFPAVGSGLAVGTVLLVMLTPWFAQTMVSPTSAVVLYVVLLGSGLLFVLPLLTEELLPRWATPPVRTFLAFIDGLLDAVPGIVVMTSSVLLVPSFPGFASGASGLTPLMDQRLGGGAMLAVAEAVGLPVIGAVFVEWIRSDERDAREVDARLDDEALTAAAPGVAPAAAPAAAPGTVQTAAPAVGEPAPPVANSVLWWEQDPRMAGRFRQRD